MSFTHKFLKYGRDWLNAANTMKRKQTRSLNLIIVGKDGHTK